MRSDKEISEHIEMMKKREMPTWVLKGDLNYEAIEDDLLDFVTWLLEIG
ncbi:MAG: hypothetical protein HXS48_15140 [Theionarchaea archaeon]|nr:hypothetical protein [Theionarchaea archaeon]